MPRASSKKRSRRPSSWKAELNDVRGLLETIDEAVIGHLDQCQRLFEAIGEAMAEQSGRLEKVRLTNEVVEETLMNCLQAIRQTEALQAWYPASNGFREMKVVGPHPKWTDDRVKAGQRADDDIAKLQGNWDKLTTDQTKLGANVTN